MKVAATERPRANILGLKKDAACSIMKSTGIEFQGEKFALSEEMRECFLKLSDMVPDVPRNESGNIDGTVLMQYVIDYILDLELQLDDQDQVVSGFSLQAQFVETSPNREPLSESSKDNIVYSQFDCSNSPSSRTQDCEIRPPSK